MKPLDFGQTTIDRLVEIDQCWVDPHWLYPNITPEMVARHQQALGPGLLDPVQHKLCISFHSYVIRTATANILVDTCNGNHKNRPRAPWQHMLASSAYLENLARLGLQPADIDIVLCTHLHTDHVGWNTVLADGRWAPTFPNAQYIFSRQEFAHFLKLHEAQPEFPVNQGSFLDSVLPVVESGQAMLVDANHCVEGDLGHGVWFEDARGHTPGHVTVHVQEAGHHAVMTGDIFHHPIIFLEPSLINLGDWNPELAISVRQRISERFADTSSLLLTMHFPAPTAGRIASCQYGFKFNFLD